MRVFLLFFLILTSSQVIAQPKPKEKQPSQNDMNKLMEDAMKGMSEEEKAEMKKMMGSVMPALMEQNSKMADYPEFTSNKQLVPKKDIARINTIPKKKLSQADIGSYAGNLYNKIMTKGDAAEMALIKSVVAKAPKAIDLSNASVLAMMQGHPQAAMALSMKAAQLEPGNANMQNNMASLLTQYGYPEQAIPVLNKLKKEFPYNSTVLNNLGQAWFELGELDSAKIFTGLAIRANPFHPEAKVCGGLIEEITGDPMKAEKDYTEAMENSPNPFIDKILKNKAGDKGFEKIDFEKLKRSITIYEYFPKDWIKIPVLSDNVSGYENDMRIKNGYSKMFDELKGKIETASEAAEQEIDELMNKGEDEFAKTMMQESLKGINKMSLTAVTVEKILTIYMAQWAQQNAEDYMALKNKIDASRTESSKTGKNDKCPDFDRKNNEFLAYANPLIRKYHEEKIETFRNWLNAFCTWVWYITGNPKNTVMTMCIGWTGGLEELYENAVHDQDARARSCVKQDGDGSSFVPTPDIPNFSCPTLIKIPFGNDWEELNNGIKNFDANSFGIKNNPANPVPNQTIAFGGGTQSIAQPGKAPFVQSANGSIAPGMINSNDGEYDPGKMLEDYQDDLVLLPDLSKNNLAKALLKKMMTADCKNINKYKYKPPVFEVGLGELILEEPTTYEVGTGELVIEDPLKKIKEIKEDGDVVYVTYDDGSEVVFMEDGSILEIDAPKNPESIGKNNVSIKPKPVTPDITSKNKVYGELKDVKKQYDANGLQPSISSGIQVPGTFNPVKGLFQ